MKIKVGNKTSWAILITFLLLYGTLFILLGIERIYSFKTSIYDFGIFNQILWTFWHYGQPINTVVSIETLYEHFLGFHFSPILLLLSPLYKIWSSPALLIVTQVLLICFTSVFVYLSCKELQLRYDKKEELTHIPLVFTILFLTNPFVMNGLVFDFHELAFSALLIAIGVWALIKRRVIAFALSMMLLFLTKEHYGISIFGFGIAWGIYNHNWKIGITTGIFGIIGLFLVFFIIMPYFSGQESHAMLGKVSEEIGLDRYKWLSQPIPDIIEYFFKYRFSVIISYFVVLLSPFLFLPLLSFPLLLTASADIMVNVLASNNMPTAPISYHSMAIISVVVISACRSLIKFNNNAPAKTAKIFLSFIIIINLSFSLTFFPVFSPNTLWELSFSIPEYDQNIEKIKNLTEGEKIAVQSNIGTFFSHRRYFYIFPKGKDYANMIILKLDFPYKRLMGHTYGGILPEFYIKGLNDVLADQEYGIVYWQDNWLVLKKGSEDKFNRESVLKAAKELEDLLTSGKLGPLIFR